MSLKFLSPILGRLLHLDVDVTRCLDAIHPGVKISYCPVRSVEASSATPEFIVEDIRIVPCRCRSRSQHDIWQWSLVHDDWL